MTNLPPEIEFNRPSKYRTVEILGNGACGETVRIRDDDMECDFVAKKYKPYFEEKDDPELHRELLNRFKSEARILFRLSHPNVVRVFNYYDYSEHKTAYIVMEYIEGSDIIDYIRAHPDSIDRIFEGVVDGFVHLHDKGVLHRDIRPANILVEKNGAPKIIDFGFGKTDLDTGQNDKSISLNWWCETPPEFEEGIYNYQSEVYFVGQLFQRALDECGIRNFRYQNLISKMRQPNTSRRPTTFAEISKIILKKRFQEIDFTEEEKAMYRLLSATLSAVIASVDPSYRFSRSAQEVVEDLERLYRKTMLEEYLPEPVKLARIFVSGKFKYYKSVPIKTESIRFFVDLLNSLPNEKLEILMENLKSRLEAIEKTVRDLDDEIPF